MTATSMYWITVFLVGFFWTFGMLAQLNIDQFAAEGSADFKQTQVFLLLGSLIVGVGLGSVLAGIWSGGKVELGILPLGAGGLAIFAFLLYTVEGVLVDPVGGYTVSAQHREVVVGHPPGLLHHHRCQPPGRLTRDVGEAQPVPDLVVDQVLLVLDHIALKGHCPASPAGSVDHYPLIFGLPAGSVEGDPKAAEPTGGHL